MVALSLGKGISRRRVGRGTGRRIWAGRGQGGGGRRIRALLGRRRRELPDPGRATPSAAAVTRSKWSLTRREGGGRREGEGRGRGPASAPPLAAAAAARQRRRPEVDGREGLLRRRAGTLGSPREGGDAEGGGEQ